ncbi:winged helix-turn-helix domain-containing tetratricopeptide repeat protein [Dongia deserti]|uniref:winged helix-turn-helix domain-containing tetratricopeptide repeat protein n=1 Tax=Dongia deserti TaxID=2268030 RepID=UPI00254935D3|nr:winged helix-turn-helix domain-containing tetratricopeptide repeat protein [Dongia deserti]
MMRFSFGDHVLDPERRELIRGSETIVVGPQVFDLLLHLVQNRERVVTKDNLIDVVWGGRIVSESTLTSHINAVRKAIGDTGEEQRLIRTIARKGYRFVGEVRVADASERLGLAKRDEPAAQALVLPDRPSIAVLPFLNLSGDPTQDYFVDGVVEDITSALSRMRWLFVIARNSSFTYKGRAVDVKQVGRELGVRYVLEGSLRKSANRVRITGQLIDAGTGANIWSERFEGKIDNIFELQDQMTANVVGAIAPQLERAEIKRAKHKPTESLHAYDYYLRAMANLHCGTREAIDEALPLFYKAIEFDPAFASAYGMAAWCHFWRKVNGWISDRPLEIAEGTRLARRAVELGKDDAVALTRAGHALVHLAGDLDGGLGLLDRAAVLNPNLAAAWFLGGFVRVWRGEPEGAIAHFTQAMRLSPLDPEMYRMQAGMAVAHLFAGRFDDASSWAGKSFRDLPSFLMVVAIIAASHALAGRTDEAERAMQRLRQLDPTLRIANLTDWLPIRRPQDLAVFADGLRKAGLPE